MNRVDDFVTVAKVGAIAEGLGATFTVGDRLVAVFLSGGKYHAIDDLCPHMGASLASGYVEDGGVTCPWHAWRFCVKTGIWLDNPSAKTRTEKFEVRVTGQEIQVLVPDPTMPLPTSTTESIP